MARRVKRNDQVMIIAGADKGKVGRVLRIIADKDRVVVEGINRVWKHVRPSQRYPQGGRIQKDAPIHISNVMPLNPTTGRGTRVKFVTTNGVKHRIAVQGGQDLGAVRGQGRASAVPAASVIPAEPIVPVVPAEPIVPPNQGM
jgi:large subunit ribosomal protein L24